MTDLVGYDEITQVLGVRFVSSGLTYQYVEVPREAYEGLLQSTSKGTYMRRKIMETYDSIKMRK